MDSGVLTQWHDDKGYGFIQPSKGGARVFVHISAFQPLRGRPKVDMSVVYQPSTDANGRICAATVRCTSQGKHRSRAVSVAVIAILLVVTALFAYQQNLAAAATLAFYLAMSCLLFATYGIDKRRAKQNGRRVPEAHLQLLAVAGGWPGGLLAQRMFRHKTRKKSFLFVFWLAVLINVSCAIAIFGGAGAFDWIAPL